MLPEAEQIIDICKRLYERYHIISKSGNVSFRLQNGSIIITPSRIRKHELTARDLCIIDLDGKRISGSNIPSSEYRIHCASYKSRPDITSAIHTHSQYAIICSLATISFEYPILPETALSLGTVPTIPYAPPGTSELAQSLEPFVREHNAFILQRHGILTLGENLEEAFDRVEEVEHAAKIAYALSVKGRIPVMGRAQLLKIMNFAKKQGFPVPEIAMKLLHQILSK